ncbi:MAG: hypothetical protein ACLP59_26550 [Bryobacteraceae bacterium]
MGDIIRPHFMGLHHSKWIDLATLLAVEADSPLYNEKSPAGIFWDLMLGKSAAPWLSSAVM